jgi:hypothetical protein
VEDRRRGEMNGYSTLKVNNEKKRDKYNLIDAS